MQTAPPSRIMLGGAVLNPDSAIPRQLSVCGGAIRFNDPVGSATSGGSVDARDSKSGSARAVGLVPARVPEAPLPVGHLIAGLLQRPWPESINLNSRGRYPLAWRWFGRLPR